MPETPDLPAALREGEQALAAFTAAQLPSEARALAVLLARDALRAALVACRTGPGRGWLTRLAGLRPPGVRAAGSAAEGDRPARDLAQPAATARRSLVVAAAAIALDALRCRRQCRYGRLSHHLAQVAGGNLLALPGLCAARGWR